MEALPSEYKNIELTRSEKLFIRYLLGEDEYGYLLINVNPAMQENDCMHVLITSYGIVMFKFIEELSDSTVFQTIIKAYMDALYPLTAQIISGKLRTNKSLVDKYDKLKFPVNVVYVFPKFSRQEITINIDDENIKHFTLEHCMFKDEINKIRTDYLHILSKILDSSISDVSIERLAIDESNVNSILQRIAPEYTTIRFADFVEDTIKPGADEELLVLNEDDMAVKVFRLDTDQINIVNKIQKGDQLILACAGSGKSVLLISKCFKAAAMNPDKEFLITCYNNNLYSLYTWFIDRAGFKEKNVTCLTFHNLCATLLRESGNIVRSGKFEEWIESAIYHFNKGDIKKRFYGIFIDEVQEFSPEWYKFCFNLLENKDSSDHLFVICGDKTQQLKAQQKKGKAPWNVGEGYPNYRGGNKNIRIEKNYRNCIEINEYINRYVSYAKKYLANIPGKTIQLDPDMFLRGQAVNHGIGVEIKNLSDQSNIGECNAIVNSIKKIHDINNIPFDEIAVAMNVGHYLKRFSCWKNKKYNIEENLIKLLEKEEIPYCRMYSTETEWAGRYGTEGGIKLVKFDSVLGLDFRAVIVCGLLSLGEHEQTKMVHWDQITDENEEFKKLVEDTQTNIRRLYVACTRAKEVLHIIIPEQIESSVYLKLLEQAK